MAENRGYLRLGKAAGQSILEYTILIAAVTAALVVMTDYVRRSLGAQTKAIEVELNGATTN